MKYFKNFNNESWLKINTNDEVKSLLISIKKGNPYGPFVDYEISELIFLHFKPNLIGEYKDSLEHIIEETVFYFKKGNKNEIFKLIKEKITF